VKLKVTDKTLARLNCGKRKGKTYWGWTRHIFQDRIHEMLQRILSQYLFDTGEERLEGKEEVEQFSAQVTAWKLRHT